MRCAATIIVQLGALSFARSSHAESPLVATAAALVHDLGSPPHHVLVIASPLGSDVPAPRAEELTAKLTALVAGALGSEAVAEAHPMALAAARTKSRTGSAKLGAVIYLDVKVASGELRVTADAYPVAANGWDRVRLAPPPPIAHAYVHAPVTAEVRAYLAPVRLDRATLKKFTHGEGRVLALACGDLEGAGGNDLVVVSEKEVSWGYLQRGRFVSVRHASIASLASRSAVPWREPLATAYVVPGDGPGTLFIGASNTASVSVGPDLGAPTLLRGIPLFTGATVACASPSSIQSAFEAAFVSCVGGKPSGGDPRVPLFMDAFAAVDVVDPEGHTSRFLAAREPSETLHVMRVGSSESLTAHDVGAQVALGDLDQDGVPEVITTNARGEDALVVASFREGALVPRLKWMAPAGVDAVAVCPAEVDDAPSLVAAVGSEIWLVR